MKAQKTEFPNPVLADGRDDYIESCYFNIAFDEGNISVGKANITFPIKYDLRCNGLQSLVSNGDAAVIIAVKSSAASYSRIFRFSIGETELSIDIPKFEVVTKMEITGSIIAAHDIERFNCPGEFNDVYFGNSTFEIRKGDILAIGSTRVIYVDDSELEKPIFSIFNITCQDDIKSSIVPSFDEHKITINLNKELFELYCKFKNYYNGILLRYATGIIVYPVLVEAIALIVKDGPDSGYSENRWFRAIVKKAREIGVDLEKFDEGGDREETYTTLADRLLGNISLDALTSFKNTFDSEMDGGED